MTEIVPIGTVSGPSEEQKKNVEACPKVQIIRSFVDNVAPVIRDGAKFSLQVNDSCFSRNDTIFVGTDLLFILYCFIM